MKRLYLLFEYKETNTNFQRKILGRKLFCLIFSLSFFKILFSLFLPLYVFSAIYFFLSTNFLLKIYNYNNHQLLIIFEVHPNVSTGKIDDNLQGDSSETLSTLPSIKHSEWRKTKWFPMLSKNCLKAR